MGGRDKRATWRSPEPTCRYAPDAEMADILYRAAQQRQPQRIEDVWRQRADKGVDASPGAPAASADAPASALAQALASAQWAAATVRRLRRESKLPKETQAALARCSQPKARRL